MEKIIIFAISLIPFVMAQIKYPIGIQTFRDIITEDFIYVDKTALVYDITDRYRYVFLSRPRRFGKSLLVSTIESYFKGEKSLFNGLALESLERKWISYPVFRFDFSPANYVDESRLSESIYGSLKSIAQDYSLSLDRSGVSENFASLIKQAYLKYGKKVVILIDEYDKPLLDCLHDHDLNEKLKGELRGFYSVIKASDQYIRFAMLTGISKFGKLSIFSGMNNLKDISLIPRYNDICGISESEFHRYFRASIESFAEEHDISEEKAWSEFRKKYDGYHFASKGEGIYNPFSVINAFDDNELDDYWFESGSPSYLIRLIEKNNYRLDAIDGQKRTKLELSDITDTSTDFVPLLFQSGYLTIKGYNPDTSKYLLDFPNREVVTAFWSSLANHFLRGMDGQSAFNLKKCLKDINEGRPEDFMTSMKSLFADTNSEREKDKEIHFQNMMAIAAKMMGLTVRTEIHSAKGRCDMQILTSGYVYIFEFKINDTPEEAIKQIHEKGYALPFEADSRTIFLIGANFSTNSRTLDGWIIEML
ncbi:MAG: ATP-binding protein [Muribaculaceae bacterium]|nr:ATP-binding protein [Muribaculaceae bacterium]